jgi:hypothetical protein
MEYIGGSSIFSFTEIEPNRGCYISGTVAHTGQMVFYYGEDGFFMFTGGQSVPIGHRKVDRWFAGDADFSKEHRFTAVIDPRAKSYLLSYVSNESPDGNPDRVLVYHWAENRFSYFEQSLQSIFASYSRNVDIETDIDAEDVSLDGDAPSLDSTEYKGGRPLINAITTTGAIGSFSGDKKTAIIETTEVQLNPQGRALVQEVQLVSDASSVLTSLKTRDKLADVEVESNKSALNPYTATACVRKDAKYHRARMEVSGDWTFIDGVKLAWRPTGVR